MSAGRSASVPITGPVARWSLHLALIAALGAFIVSTGARGALALFVPLGLAPALRWRRAPHRLVTLLTVLARLALVGVLALAVLSRQLLFIQADEALGYATALGWTLAVLSVVFILGHRSWPVVTTLVPAIVGLLVLSGLKPGLTLFPWFAGGAALSLWIFAFVHGGPRRLGLPLAIFFAVGVVVAGATAALLPRAQPHVERALARTFAEGTTGLAEESRLGEFGRLAASNRVVMRVWTSAPRLLRAYVHTRFDGREWTAPRRDRRPVPKPLRPTTAHPPWLSAVPGAWFVVPPEEAVVTEDLVETRVLQSAVRDWPLLVPSDPVFVRAPASLLLRSREGELRWPRFQPARLYGVVHHARAQASRGTDEGVTAQAVALGLPARLDPRVRILAATLATDARTGPERLSNTVSWMRSQYTYSLDVGEFETGDPLAEFLFEKRAGYCEYFATAAAVLLRLQGIPTRYVKGFAVGPQNLMPGRLGVEDHYVVRERDAHAWIEVYLAGIGWVEADPTPPAALDAVRAASPGWLEPLLEAMRAHATRIWARLKHEGPGAFWAELTAATRGLLEGLLARPPLVVALLAPIIGILAWGRVVRLLGRLRSRRRARRERRAALPGELQSFLATVETHWARRGCPRPPSTGLREHVLALPPGMLSRRERDASLEVVDACYRAAYGGRTIEAGEVDSLRAAVSRLR